MFPCTLHVIRYHANETRCFVFACVQQEDFTTVTSRSQEEANKAVAALKATYVPTSFVHYTY